MARTVSGKGGKGRKEERKERGARGKEGSDRMQSFNLSVSLFLFFWFLLLSLVPRCLLLVLSRVTQIPSTCTIWAARTVPFWTKFVFHR
jgi:hypothetical protein